MLKATFFPERPPKNRSHKRHPAPGLPKLVLCRLRSTMGEWERRSTAGKGEAQFSQRLQTRSIDSKVNSHHFAPGVLEKGSTKDIQQRTFPEMPKDREYLLENVCPML